VTRPVFAWMKSNGGRVSVNTTSTSGLFGNFGQTNNGAAKAGVWALSPSLAIEDVRSGIRVWTLAAVAATRLTNGLPPDDAKGKWRQSEFRRWCYTW